MTPNLVRFDHQFGPGSHLAETSPGLRWRQPSGRRGRQRSAADDARSISKTLYWRGGKCLIPTPRDGNSPVHEYNSDFYRFLASFAIPSAEQIVPLLRQL